MHACAHTQIHVHTCGFTCGGVGGRAIGAGVLSRPIPADDTLLVGYKGGLPSPPPTWPSSVASGPTAPPCIRYLCVCVCVCVFVTSLYEQKDRRHPNTCQPGGCGCSKKPCQILEGEEHHADHFNGFERFHGLTLRVLRCNCWVLRFVKLGQSSYDENHRGQANR